MAQTNKRVLPPDYVEAQHSAMRWLVKQGLSLEEVREARWGMVDEGDKIISIPSSVTHIKYDTTTGVMFRKTTEGKTFKIPIKETGHEWFFLKSKIKCPWMFIREWPKTWRKEGSRESLYSLSEVEQICKDLDPTSINTSLLTKLPDFDRIKLSNLNITKLKTERVIEEIAEAEIRM